MTLHEIMSKLILIIGVKIFVQVVACVLKRKNRILISLRPKGKEFSGYYEFPGGKVKKGELFLESLSRELLEELGVRINLNRVIFLESYKIIKKKRKLNLNFFFCPNWSGQIKNMEGQKFKWVLIDELNCSDLLESNKRFVNYLSFIFFPTSN